MIYLDLFWCFAKIGLIGFGGGYAILPIIQDFTVTQHEWLTQQEFIDLVTISQVTPGPIFLKMATFVGCKEAGMLGGIVATFGAITPSFILIVLLSMLYYRYRKLTFVKDMLRFLRPAVVGLIATATVFILALVLFGQRALALNQVDTFGIGLLLISLVLLRTTKINFIMLILLGGVAGVLWHLMA